MHWAQRAKERWLALGSIPVRVRWGFGGGLTDGPAVLETTPACFQPLSALGVHLSSDQVQALEAPFVEAEVYEAVFQMGSMKAPGPDGFVAGFYQKNWDCVGDDVTQMVLAFLHSGPISLCNVLYKVIARVLVNRLRPVLKSLISIFQNAFVPSRLITDNILLAHETIEFIPKKRKGRSCFALKLDMSKVYDRVKWSAVLDVLSSLGFSPKWINLVSQRLSTVSFSVLVNGIPSEFFSPRCGLRQGDPLSPYLFILVSQVLSANLSIFASQSVCRGVAISRHSPPVSHLFFADDSFFFLNFDLVEDSMQEGLAEAYRTLALVGKVMGGSGYGLKEGNQGQWSAGLGYGMQRVVLKSNIGEIIVVARLLVDGAWDKRSWKGAVAWCSVGDGDVVRSEGRREIFASSVLMAEALAVWNALAWAFDRG
ncbi:hypothetical protein RHSIM_Rhsim08G0108800 [Rhododendron simsii]|uniref:Reverse transcriptase domain-containing protein n=1 Tax=Rhododendron simsii TaxID=118357 RepID=A0A834LFK3_RHOSS|nr:hypothetical protein RHSIM_Rhsim08G0108800 [Rhododendron simsii]